MKTIDLRSDTHSKPTPEMLEAMRKAEVGDDCYDEDPTVKQLQEYCCKYFGKDAALFMPSGTMTNQVAIRALLNPGDEIILDASYHVNFFESAQTADLGKTPLNLCKTKTGIITVEVLKKALDRKARSPIYSIPKLLIIENTINAHGGKVFPLATLKELREFTKSKGILIYMDGARLLNACVAAGVSAKDYAEQVDCLGVCFAKGLAAPFGSILLGNKDFIDKCKVFRKWYGGALHQVGYMAAPALYAIQHNVQRLSDDHSNSALLKNAIGTENKLEIKSNNTNMLIFDVSRLGVTAKEFVDQTKKHGVLLYPWTTYQVRAVTYINITKEDIQLAARVISDACKCICNSTPIANDYNKENRDLDEKAGVQSKANLLSASLSKALVANARDTNAPKNFRAEITKQSSEESNCMTNINKRL